MPILKVYLLIFFFFYIFLATISTSIPIQWMVDSFYVVGSWWEAKVAPDTLIALALALATK